MTPGRRDGRDQRPRPEVVGPDLGAGRDVEPLAGAAVADVRVDPPRLDDRGDHRHPELARGLDVVLAPEHQPERHRVLGEVRVGPLVDVVRHAVAPRLEELRRGPRVIDLVEVHLVRLGEAEGPQRHRGQDEDDEEPQVEPVEAAAALAGQGPRSGRPGSDRSPSRWRNQPISPSSPIDGRRDQVGIVATTARRRRPPPGRAAPDAAAPTPAAPGRSPAGRERPLVGRVGRVLRTLGRRRELRLEPRVGAPAQLEHRPAKNAIANMIATAAIAGSDLRDGPDPQPVADLRVVADQHDEDDVHVREQARRSGPRT